MNKVLLAICVFCSAWMSCKKSENKPCYGLLSPYNNQQNISPFFAKFLWLNCTTMPAQFVLSANRDFSKPITQTDTYATSLIADTVLYPLTTYYWIVTVHGQDQSFADSFTTSAIAPIISGTYAGQAFQNNYGLVGDTFYAYQLTVHDVGNDKISLQLPGIDSIVFSKITTTDTTAVYTCLPCTGKYAGFKNLTYFPLHGTIDIVFQTTGVNYDEWDFTGGKVVY